MYKGKTALKAFRVYRKIKDSAPNAAAEVKKVFDENKEYFGYGYIQDREDLVPPVPLIYWSFRVMVGLGSFLLALMFVVLFFVLKGRIRDMKWLQWICLLSIPLVYLAGQAGWIVAEVGRQPWAIQDLLPVSAAISNLSAGAVQTTFFIFVAVFTAFLAIELSIMFKAIKKGPQVEENR